MIVGHGIGSIFTSMFTVGLATDVTSGEGEFIIWDDDSFLYLDTAKKVITNVEVSPIITDTSLNIDDDADLTFVSHYIDGNQVTADEAVVGPTLSETSLACWIPFNGDPNDDSANAHDFSPQNGPVYITGPGGTGQAIEFNSASNEYADIADHADFDCTGAFSIGAWIKSNDLSVDTGFYQKIAGASGICLHWENTGSGYWRSIIGVVNSADYSDSSVDWVGDDTWQHFVFTRANATADIKIYKNAGTAVSMSTSTAVSANTASAELGRRYASSGEIDIAEFFLFNRELTADEVTTIYNSGDRLSYADITWT